MFRSFADTMKTTLLFVLICLVSEINCLSVEKPTEVVHNSLETDRDWKVPTRALLSSDMDDCDISRIPTMDQFDMDKFSGTWYELAKTVSGYLDADDGSWKITVNNASNDRYKFLFSGRDGNSHCIRPIPGKIHPGTQNPGEIHFKYRTYSTDVSETIRVLHTDYDNFAAIYSCVDVNEHTGKCHPAGIFASIWTRKSHVQHGVFDKAAAMLEKACIHKSTLRIKLLKGPCKVDDLGMRDDMILVAPNTCFSPVSPGSCTGQVKRYYYDELAKDCLEFAFTGCGGNDNNFLTKNECANTCIDISSKDTNCKETSVCALACPPCCREDSQGCITCSCQTVIVDPVPNCVRDESQCAEECIAEEKYPGCYVCVCEDSFPVHPKDIIPPMCLEVKHKGLCSAREERYYFNAMSERCEKFDYTGCGGNKNNFLSLEQCQMECKKDSLGQAPSFKIYPDGDQDENDDGGPDGATTLSTSYMSLLSIFFSVLWFKF